MSISGRVEQENKLKQKINEKLNTLPSIFSEFYDFMDADGKSYGTCKRFTA